MTLLLPRKRLARVPRGITGYWPLNASTCEFSSAGGQVRPLDLIGNNYGADAKSMGASGLPPFDGDGIGYSFNATTNTYLTLNADPLNAAGAGNQTIAVWAYFRSFVSSDGSGLGVPRLVSFSSDISICVDDGTAGFAAGTVTLDINTGAVGVHSTSALSLNGWNHVVCTVSGTTCNIYINGVLVTTATGLLVSGTAGVWGLGCRSNLLRIMNGKLAHAMVCQGTLLTQGEIADLYNSFFVAEEIMPALFTPAVGGAFLAAWARGSNLPVIGTGNY